MADFGSGLGAVIGANLADNQINDRLDDINATTTGFADKTSGYDNFGKSFLNPATEGIGDARAMAGTTQGYNQFMSGYTNTPAAQYQLQQADAVQENSAASRGGLLAGSNLRALSTINNGIVAQNANTAYDEYLKGSNTQFGQLEQALGNMFSAIGVGQTATGQQASLDAARIGAQANIANTQQKNDQQKGAGIGSMFSGVASMPFGF